MRILVTGAAGFIGSAVVDLLRCEHDVRAVDNFSFGSVRRIGDVEVEEMDITVPEQVEDMVSGQDVIIHLAGYTGIVTCERDPKGAAIHMLVGTKYLTDMAVKARVKQMFYASTFAVYGQTCGLVTENTNVAPIGTYATLKAACEYVLLAAQRLDGLNTVIFRQTNVYGRGLISKGTLVNLLVDRVLRCEPMTIYGSGKQVRNFVHVRDVALAYKLAIKRGVSGVFNLGSRETLSVRTIIEMVNEVSEEVLGYQVAVEKREDRGVGNHEIQSTELDLDVSRIESELDFHTRFSVRATVEEALSCARDGRQ